jgi:polysaccharide export outer membrane protein
MNKISVRAVGLVILTAWLCSCASLPRSGPSTSEVQAASKSGISIVDVDAAVARHLLETRPTTLFSDLFSATRGSGEVVGPGDVLEVSVWEAPPAVLFSSAVKDAAPQSNASVAPSSATTFPPQMVGRDGSIYMPFAGKTPAAGKSLEDIESAITGKLQGKANQPQVLVRLVANNTAYVTVVGEVTKSTRVALTPRGECLLDALAAAGGTTRPVEKTTLQVTREATVYALPLDTIIRDPRQNIVLRSGDVVTALYQPSSFTAMGATGKSDEINFESQGISLAQALARAGGVIDSRSNAEGVFIFRFESGDANQLINGRTLPQKDKMPVIYRINLKDPRSIFVAQSFPMKDKDILYVANAPAAELQKFLNLLVSTIYPIEGAITLSK